MQFSIPNFFLFSHRERDCLQNVLVLTLGSFACFQAEEKCTRSDPAFVPSFTEVDFRIMSFFSPSLGTARGPRPYALPCPLLPPFPNPSLPSPFTHPPSRPSTLIAPLLFFPRGRSWRQPPSFAHTNCSFNSHHSPTHECWSFPRM